MALDPRLRASRSFEFSLFGSVPQVADPIFERHTHGSAQVKETGSLGHEHRRAPEPVAVIGRILVDHERKVVEYSYEYPPAPTSAHSPESPKKAEN